MMSADEIVRAALAEAGYPNADVETGGIAPNGEAYIYIHGDDIPDEARWLAWYAARCIYVCWPCWRALINYPDCEHDPYTSERPVLVRA